MWNTIGIYPVWEWAPWNLRSRLLEGWRIWLVMRFYFAKSLIPKANLSSSILHSFELWWWYMRCFWQWCGCDDDGGGCGGGYGVTNGFSRNELKWKKTWGQDIQNLVIFTRPLTGVESTSGNSVHLFVCLSVITSYSFPSDSKLRRVTQPLPRYPMSPIHVSHGKVSHWNIPQQTRYVPRMAEEGIVGLVGPKTG